MADIELKLKNNVVVKGILKVPEKAKGLVIFAHGSGSSRLSPRNNFVANVLQKAGLATLLMDLLTPEEEADRSNVFDIDLLSERLEQATVWTRQIPEIKDLPIGYFGSSTGAAAALQAAAVLGEQIKAVVSRGGRSDLAMDHLDHVIAATLLIVGGDDDVVISFNEQSYEQLKSKKELKIIPGAGHLFEESGALEEVARLASEWFIKNLKV
ncbi:hydrolase [Candidatus Wolfebacteria bacterium]|nr:MAG: hydrolase [Candidatus Wolfebacteria bacterium]